MKRGILLCILALLLLLTACGSGNGENAQVFKKDGYTVDQENRTITSGADVYTYTVSGNGSISEITITYPNGATYFWQWNGNSGHGGWSDDFDPVRYADGDPLMDLIHFQPEPERSGVPGAVIFLLLAIGAFHLAAPRTAWYLSYGWRFKGAEPSDAALVLGRAGGVIAVIIALILFLA